MYKLILQYKKILLPCLLVFGCLILINCLGTSVAFADALTDNTGIFNFGEGQTAGTEDSLSKQLYDIASGLSYAGHMIIIIMTVVAGCMVVFGLEDGKKVMWSYVLGIGLALNFADVLLNSGMFGGSLKDLAKPPSPADNAALEKILQVKSDATSDILSDFMVYYNGLIVANGQAFLVPIALKLTVILASIDASIKLAMDMITGDKIKFLISTTLKVGFYMFMIENWIAFAGAWSKFCQYIGFHAGGIDTVGANLKPDSIWQNGVQMFNTIVTGAGSGTNTTATGAVVGTVNSLMMKIPIIGQAMMCVIIVCVIAMIVCLFLTAIEMFMARIEFYTMVLIGIIMIPFGVCEKLEFLSRQAISAVFNLGAKVMIISFIQGISVTLLTKYVKKFMDAYTSGIGAHIPVLLQMVLLCAILFVITKKIPDMVTGFLNGSPSLSGSSMMGALKQGVKTTSDVSQGAGFVKGAYANAKARALARDESGTELAMSTMGGTIANLGRAAALAVMTKNPITAGFNKGVQQALQPNGLIASQADPEGDMNKHSFASGKKGVLGGVDSDGKSTGNDMYSLLETGGIKKDKKDKDDDDKKSGKSTKETSKEQSPAPVINNNPPTGTSETQKAAASEAGAVAGRQAGTQAGADAAAANTKNQTSNDATGNTKSNGPKDKYDPLK